MLSVALSVLYSMPSKRKRFILLLADTIQIIEKLGKRKISQYFTIILLYSICTGHRTVFDFLNSYFDIFYKLLCAVC